MSTSTYKWSIEGLRPLVAILSPHKELRSCHPQPSWWINMCIIIIIPNHPGQCHFQFTLRQQQLMTMKMMMLKSDEDNGVYDDDRVFSWGTGGVPSQPNLSRTKAVHQHIVQCSTVWRPLDLCFFALRVKAELECSALWPLDLCLIPARPACE